MGSTSMEDTNTGASSHSESSPAPFKKWFMRQYWRIQQSQTIISMAFWVTTLTLLIWPYVKWRFEDGVTLLESQSLIGTIRYRCIGNACGIACRFDLRRHIRFVA